MVRRLYQTVSDDWLQAEVSVEEAEARIQRYLEKPPYIRADASPADRTYLTNENRARKLATAQEWLTLKAQFRTGDTLRGVKTPRANIRSRMGMSGFALVRDGKVVTHIEVWLRT